MLPFFFDPTYILVIVGAGLCMWASHRVNSTFQKYNRISNRAGMTGQQAARRILDDAGLTDVRVQQVHGRLTDHYDPRSRTVNLSESTFGLATVAALGVAAHECGHAIQHAKKYVPLAVRGNLVPVANFGSMIAWPLIIFGLFINSHSSTLLINIGIIAFSMSVLFQIITLPVELNASSRALAILGDSRLLAPDELEDTKKVLSAAALTYIASAAASILQLVRIILLTGGRRRRD